MAKPTGPAKKARRSLIGLGALVLVLVGLNGIGLIPGMGGSATPELALDLQGGTQIILAPQTSAGQSVSQEQLDQAVSIIRQRVDASGVAESEITTQGGSNIVVSVAGEVDDATRERITASAALSFRPVILTDAAPVTTVDEEGAPAEPYTPAPELERTPSPAPTGPSDIAYVTPYLQDLYTNFDCARDSRPAAELADDEAVVLCDPLGTVKYLVGPVEIQGERISDATSGFATTQSGASTGQSVVNLEFDGEGSEQFSAVTQRLTGATPPTDQFAIVLDGSVISAPQSQAVITNGQAQISGSFTEESAQALADQLRYGALPISFTVQSTEQISATLGSEQLRAGLIAGAIGLGFVVLYMLLQYRTLGLVTLAALAIAAVLTYLLVVLLSWRQGYRLSLAGVAGLIIGIGVTADSFIVYFERIRDELRDGRGLESAIEAGWKRAFRTIVASDVVNLLAAVILYWLAVGNVRGFAFTLGLTTVVDFLVVVLFTHPLMQLLARRRFFADGHRLSGLDPTALGAVYRGRATFRDPGATAARGGRSGRSSGEAARRQTIAERKAALQTTGPKDADGKDD